MNAMILAAGRGERLRPITDTTPKALVEVAGTSLLEHHLQRLARAGVRQVVINLDWLGEQIVERVGDGRRYGLQLCYSPEYGDVLETAGGIQRALPMLGSEPFWVINADVYTDFELADIVLNENVMGHLILVPRPEFKSQGDFGLVDGLICNTVDPEFTFSGIAYYRPEFFSGLSPGKAALAPLLRAAATQNTLSGALHPGLWEDVGTVERLTDVRARFNAWT